jgi:uncharacterized protein
VTYELFYRVSIEAGDAEYDLSHDLSSLTIEEDSAQADKLTINLSDPSKVFSHAFQEGMAVEVDLGTVDDHSIMFRGRIYQVNSDFPQDGVPTVVLNAYDNSMKMGLRRRNRTFRGNLDSIVQLITADEAYGFAEQKIELRGNPEFDGNGLRQQDETDLAFLLRLASENGCEMFVSADDTGDTLHFLSQYYIMREASPAVTLYHGRCDVPNRLLTFEANSDVSNIQLPRVFSGIDLDSGELHEEEAPVEDVSDTDDPQFSENLAEFRRHAPDRADDLQALIDAAPDIQDQVRQELGGVTREATPCFTAPQALQERAQNQFSVSLLGMRASGATVGNQRIHAQTTIRIADVGGRFSGKWYLSQVRHTLDRQGYRTEFECQR